MHHFVVKFSKKNFASGGKGALTPLTKILRTFLDRLADKHTDHAPAPVCSNRPHLCYEGDGPDRISCYVICYGRALYQWFITALDRL